MSKIKDYNSEVQNWDFDREELPEFLRLLSERNLYIKGETPVVDFHPDCKKPSKNVAVVDSQSIKVLDQIAFHVGFPNQRRLYTLVDEDTGSRTNDGVFFSLKPEDVVYFSEFDKSPLSMVYFLDSRKSNGARVQIKYESPVISRYDLDDMLKVTGEDDKRNLREMHRRLNQKWIRQNTIPFNVEQLEYFKGKGYDWLVIPDPVDVKD